MPQVALNEGFVGRCCCPLGIVKIDFFDKKQTGFLLEVRASGRKTYYQRFTDERGRTRQYKIGSAEFLSLRDARASGKAVVAQMILGSNPQLRRKILRAIPTLSEFVAEKYLPYIKLYKRSWNTDETILRIHILPVLGKLQLDEVLADRITPLLSALKAKGYSTGTLNRVVIVLRHLFNLALKWQVDGITRNPTAGLPIAPDVCRQRFLSEEEAKRLINSLEQDENEQAAKAILLLLLTGARRNEITYAKWEQVNWDRKILVIPLSKSGKRRSLNLNTTAIEVLRTVAATPNNPFIFPSPVTGRPSPSLHFPWERIRARANLKDLRLHDLRHSFASFLVNQGVSLYVVQDLLGHSNSRYSQRYAHLTSATLKDAAQKVGDILKKA